MPKSPTYALIWSSDNNGYLLHTPDAPPQLLFPGKEEAWQAWLTTHSSFSFQGQHGHLNVFKELRARGTGYWYAYHMSAGRMRKHYLGRSTALTLARLEEVAQALQEPVYPSQGIHVSKEERADQQEDEPGLIPLVTRFSPPQVPTTLVERERLLLLLDTAFSRPLTLVSASAGWGKTTLLTAWAHRHPQQTAWLSLEPLDNDPTRFWSSIIAALQRCLPDLGKQALALLHTSTALSSSLMTLLNEVAVRQTATAPIVLFLDDYHVIEEPAIHTSLLFCLEHLPPSLRLVIASRVDPDFPLSRLRVRGSLGEIRDTELRFTREETQRFLTHQMDLALSETDIALLEARTEGWIASLHLAALILQKQVDLSAGVQTLTGSQRVLLDYMREEILESQPQPLQHFLLQTSGLNRLNASLCDAVTGRTDSQLWLEQILRSNLFLQSLEGEQQWYRYHLLWSSALQHEARHRLGEAELCQLAGRESRWYEAQRLLPEAIEAALRAREFAFAAELITRMITPHSFRNPYPLFRRWLEQLPAETLHASPFLSFVYAEALIFTSDRRDSSIRTRVEQPLRIAEQGFRAQQDAQKLAEVLSLRASLAVFRNDLPTAFTLAHQMLHTQPAGEQHWRGTSLAILAMQALLSGNMEQARQLILEARIAYEADQSLPGFFMTAFLLGEISVGQGELSQAAHYYQQVVSGEEKQAQELFTYQLTTTTGAQDTFFARQALTGLAQLAYEWNELDIAQQRLNAALENARIEEMHFLTTGVLLQAHLLHARGQSRQAQEFLNRLSPQARSPQFLREIRACSARIALATGDRDKGEAWLRTIQDATIPDALLRQEEEALLLARLRIAQQQGKAALEILAPWKAQAQVQQCLSSTLAILLLEALAYFAQGQLLEAKQTLLLVLRKAQGERYQRLFLDEGPTMKLLLQTLLPEVHDAPLLSYIYTLLRAFGQKPGSEDVPFSEKAAFLAEPLSVQEQRVLRLLVVGRSNAEIASEFVISVNTVRTHIQSLYRKLNVHNRVEASEVARRLSLL
ncbi:transcriptional regulator [Ktedonosporobacter rubrisoli]|uniref:Transcriptional regulator n=1 Tax=Ktedonosporobacter rubrisoli TaxID=2509675 RepID=A0A4V0Z0B4_KTERU|nr:LuxR C-terminal-related transcriptional regulator [Ktedonosporobacter rubrisoli]QBD82631.1 transcriptional regulator [Ktedonosporobacter rubrisoli]